MTACLTDVSQLCRQLISNLTLTGSFSVWIISDMPPLEAVEKSRLTEISHQQDAMCFAELKFV